MVTPTPLGTELGQLIKAMENYHYSYNELINAINKNFDILPNTNLPVLNGKLRSRGWTIQT